MRLFLEYRKKYKQVISSSTTTSWIQKKMKKKSKDLHERFDTQIAYIKLRIIWGVD